MSRSTEDTTNNSIGESVDVITVTIADQLFGIPVLKVHDVFAPQSVTSVPLAREEVAGVLNLRGRIVTAIDVRDRLGFEKRGSKDYAMAIGIEKGNESYGLVIDKVGEVLTVDPTTIEPNPTNLNPKWQEISKGVCRLEDDLLVILDVDLVLSFDKGQEAA